MPFSLAKKLLFERLIFAPIMQAFSLYTLARFEGKNHAAAMKQLVALYLPVLQANWKWLTMFQIINLAFVPPIVSIQCMQIMVIVPCTISIKPALLYSSVCVNRFF